MLALGAPGGFFVHCPVENAGGAVHVIAVLDHCQVFKLDGVEANCTGEVVWF